MNGLSAPLITAVRGPIMLILIGVLIALGQFGSLAVSDTWPVLIIAYGVLKLLERSFTPGTAGR